MKKYIDNENTSVRDDIENSIEQIESVVSQINRTKRERDDALQLIQLTKLLRNGKTFAVNSSFLSFPFLY